MKRSTARGLLVSTGLALGACCPSRPADRVEETRPAPTAAVIVPATPPAPFRFAFRGESFTLGKDHPFPSCEEPERWLTFTQPAEFGALYCSRCGDSTWCNPDSGDESGGPWAFASPSRTTKDGFWCNELRYLGYAVGAGLGVAVPSGRFARYFGQQDWYSPQPSVTEADLPAAARENIGWLGDLLTQCDADGPKTTAADQALVDAWFDANYAGHPKLPKLLFQNCNRVGADEFRALLRNEPYLRYTPRTPIVRVEAAACAEVRVPPRGRALFVHVGAWLTAERCTECEGHEILQIVADDKGRVVALGAMLTG
jgi:hypothetical protein